MNSRKISRAALSVCVLLAVRDRLEAVTTTFDFEAPVYDTAFMTTGILAGQDQWRTNAMVPELFGYVDPDTASFLKVTTTNPISGAQSIRYDNPDIGLNDHSRGFIAEAAADGVAGTTDITAGVTIRAESDPMNAGFFIGESPTEAFPTAGVIGGSTPVLMRLFNGNIQTYSIASGFVDKGTYNVGDTVELVFEIDLDGHTYNLLNKNITQGQTSLSVIHASAPFTQGFPSNGRTNVYDVGAALFLRNGTVTYDNLFIEYTEAPPVAPGDFDIDGDVDGRDFLIWQRGGSPTPFSATDLANWQDNYASGPLGAISAVPEPFGLSLILLGAMGLAGDRRGRLRSR